MTISADTNVPFGAEKTSFGNIELTEARLEPGKFVRVHLDTDYSLENEADAQLEFKGDKCPLTIAITADDRNKAYAGNYSDTVTFNIVYQEAAAPKQ